MTGWTKKPFVSPGRHVKAEIERCPHSFWADAKYQQDREAFMRKAAEEQKRMATRGLHADRLNWKD